MTLSYQCWVRQNRLREEPGPILSESILQRIWFEQLLRQPLTTLAGESITLRHPGFWNHRAGPDFLAAAFATHDGQIFSGDVELHRHSSDWDAHRHSPNPAYRSVLLHVFWQASPTPTLLPSPLIRQIALEHQLAAPLTELISLFRATPAEIAGGEKPGRCHSLLLALPPAQLSTVLEEAGWHRLRQRRLLAQARLSAHRFDQATWIALAEGLGFSENRESFASLARAVPIAHLLSLPDSLDREAILYGVAGLLPDPTHQPCSPRAHSLLQQLWSRWWRHRETWSDRIFPKSLWHFGATRPNNSPLRRLAALSFLSHPNIWPDFVSAVRSGSTTPFLHTLRSATHPFWDQHASWEGRILPSASRLVGHQRATALLFQVLAPLTELSEPELNQQMLDWPGGGDAGLLRSACLRLLGIPFLPADIQTHLAREGLLQIYKDFCRATADACPNCSFPDFLNSKSA